MATFSLFELYLHFKLYNMPNTLSIFFLTGEFKAIYVIGATELAAHGRSVWFNLLSEEDIQVLEYLSDLRVSK